MGVRGDESTTDAGDASELVGDASRCLRCPTCSGATVVASEFVDCVIADPCLELILRTGEPPSCERWRACSDERPDRLDGDAILVLFLSDCFTVLG